MCRKISQRTNNKKQKFVGMQREQFSGSLWLVRRVWRVALVGWWVGD